MTGYISKPLAPQDALLFVHIPKAAGTSLNVVLDEQFPQEQILELPAWLELPSVKTDLATPRLFRGHVYHEFFRLIPRPVRFLTMLRDPIERTISNYEMMRRNSDDPWHPLVKELTFGEYIRHPQTRVMFENTQTRLIGSQFHIKSLEEVATAVEQVPATLLEIAKERLERYDFVGVVERFRDSLDLLCYRFGWHPVRESVHDNAAPEGRLRQQELTSSDLHTLQAATALDAELYRFAQGLLDDRLTQMRRALLKDWWRASLITPPGKVVEADFRTALPGTGWHRREKHPDHGWFRWSGPGVTASMTLPLPADRPVRVAFRVIAAANEEVLSTLALTANGHPVPLTHALDETRHLIYRGELPAVLPRDARWVDLVWSMSRTFLPESWGTAHSDQRRLGFATNQVRLSAG